MKAFAGRAACFMILVASPVLVATACTSTQYAQNEQQGQNDRGDGTATPELPSGVLVGIGLVPLLAGAAVFGQRRWKRKSA